MKDRLLVVDDEASILNALTRLLTDENYEVVTATNGLDALSLMDKPFQVVLSDMRMPGMDGATFLERVAELQSATVRMVLSVHVDKSTILDAVNRGVIYRYIEKPWNDDELRITIRHAFEYYHLRMEKISLADSLAEMNRNLERIVSEQTRVITARNNILTHLLSVHSLEESLSFIINEITHCASLFEIAILRREGHSESFRIAARWRHDDSTQPTLFVGESIAAQNDDIPATRILLEGKPVLSRINDLANPFRRCVRYSIPLVRNDKGLGILSVVFPTSVEPAESQLDVVSGFSRLVAIALADAGITEGDVEFADRVSSLLQSFEAGHRSL